jgi:uncharacterized lipoprotein YmbA
MTHRPLFVGLAALAAACSGTPESRYYLPEPTALVAPADGPVLFVDTVTVANYADRSQLVTRVDDSRVVFEEFDVWAQPVPELLTRYLVDALGNRFGRDNVLATPGRRSFDPDWRVEVDVIRLDADQAGAVVLDARWTLFRGRDDRFVGTGRERLVEQAEPNDIPGRIAAVDRALDDLAGRIAAAVRAR